MVENISIYTEWIRLDQLLKLSGKAETGGQAKELIFSGEVLVNGETCLMRGKKIRPGDRVKLDNEEILVTSSGNSSGETEST